MNQAIFSHPGGPGDRSASTPRCREWRSCLLCIDLQVMGCEDGPGFHERQRTAGIPDEETTAYLRRLRDIVLPNVHRLQDGFRGAGQEIIHTRIQSLTRDGRDRSPEHKRLGLHAPPGSREGAFMPQVAPVHDEIVLDKTASGVFTSTNLAYLLHNLCIEDLYVVGVYTNECVSSAVRSACDLGFKVTLVRDGCAASTGELHEASLTTLRDRYARVLDTDDVLDLLLQESMAD